MISGTRIYTCALLPGLLFLSFSSDRSLSRSFPTCKFIRADLFAFTTARAPTFYCTLSLWTLAILQSPARIYESTQGRKIYRANPFCPGGSLTRDREYKTSLRSTAAAALRVKNCVLANSYAAAAAGAYTRVRDVFFFFFLARKAPITERTNERGEGGIKVSHLARVLWPPAGLPGVSLGLIAVFSRV